VVNVLALGTLTADIDVRVNIAAGDLGQLCFNVESKGTEATDVDGLALAEVVVEVSDEGFPDDKHLLEFSWPF
jgi:hypothetical protein